MLKKPLTSSKPCELHKVHRPKPLYTELHHIVPQAWQAAWFPDTSSKRLWRPETVALCRTSHGNVHFTLVDMMKAFEHTGIIPTKVVKGEVEVARQAMVRFTEAGGDLHVLIAKGLYGEI